MGTRRVDDYDIPNGRSVRQERDLVVAPNEFCYVLDRTKGNINVHVGPLKTSLADTDQLVVFDYKTKRFVPSDMSHAVQTFATAPEGWYLVLKNPNTENKQPQEGKADVLRSLNVGRKVNIPGPCSFALWPGQMVKTVKGHILRSNQYLVVRVYDEETARDNWNQTIVKKADGEETTADKVIGDVDLTMGKLFIIKGTEVSFYIPPTGVEVVMEGDNYIREAVTLERLEYSILKDENGKKRYVKGPDVVFPQPTEIFLKKDNSRKFKAYELSPISGLYIKVIADYTDSITRKVLNFETNDLESKTEMKEGDEIFITGEDQMIYFPREEHAIMTYGDKDRHYATAIPAGEARYVLNRLDGKIRLEKGPSMFLPDPRLEVLVRRVLTPKDVMTWFPGNVEALSYNRQLSILQISDKDGYVTADTLEMGDGLTFAAGAKSSGYASKRVYDEDWDSRERATQAKMADYMNRSQEYTKPRTITIDSKYEGAVVIDVWTGYAIKVKSKTNEHKIIVGPATYMLEYDESLEHMELSTGTPKTDDELMKTAYLRVLNNKVSDVINAETADNCNVKVALSYRVNFEGDNNKWFDVENYVKFMCDHMRSLGKAVIKGKGIEEFYANPHEIIRDAFLGKSENGERLGRSFKENGMRIYEVEVLNVNIGDREIAAMLVANQNEIVKQNIKMAHMRRNLEIERETQEMNRQRDNEYLATKLNGIVNSMEADAKNHEGEMKKKDNLIAMQQAELEIEKAVQNINNEKHEAALTRENAEKNASIEYNKAKLNLALEKIAAEVNAVKEKGQAITPQMVAALQSIGDKELAAKLSENMAVQAMLGGKSVVEVFQNLLKGTRFENISNTFLKDDYFDSDR